MTEIKELPHRIIPSLETSQENWEWVIGNLEDIIDARITAVGPDKNYIHTQSTPAATWSVSHNLSKRATPIVVDGSFNEIVGEINFISDDQLSVTFTTAETGYVYVN